MTTFASREEAEESLLVLLAMGLPGWIAARPDGIPPYEIRSAPADAEAIERELAAYARENEEFAGETQEPPAFAIGLEAALLWVIAVFVVFHFQQENPMVTEWFSNSSRAVFAEGQWWRPLTALFLHGDFDHLLGNVVFGLLFFLLVSRSVGPRTGWLLIFLSGTLGNLVTAWIRYPVAIQSLGASTATFGAIGILVGQGTAATWRSASHRRWVSLIVPVGAGLVLLGWLGAGEPPTDVLGHLIGFVVGWMLGVTAGSRRLRAEAHCGGDDGVTAPP